jgi:poly(hydroxyalkanoate) depolymerase family esterase
MKMLNSFGRKSILLLSIIPVIVFAGTYKEIKDFGENPGNTKMFLYIPDKVATKPSILVAIHWCSGTANAIYTSNTFSPLADQYGFIVIFPDANSSDGCWEVHSQEALTHNGGSDPLSIVSMIKYVIKNYNADSTRVFASGVSSGAMMTNVLMGSYPDIFNAGSAFAGVPFGCFAGPNAWNTECSQGKISKTAQEWGELVRAAFPAYTGSRPRVQLWHGTKDDVLYFNNFNEAIKQWTNVLGVNQTPTTTENNTPASKWIRTRYTDGSGTVLVEAIEETDYAHNLQVKPEQAIAFFGLDKPVNIKKNMINFREDISAEITITRNNTDCTTFNIFSKPGHTKCDIFTVEGTKVATIFNQNSSSGVSHGIWDGSLKYKNKCAPGLYIFNVSVNNVIVCSAPLCISLKH